jgi:hypothetical protein
MDSLGSLTTKSALKRLTRRVIPPLWRRLARVTNVLLTPPALVLVCLHLALLCVY